jgi:hypothetical protein
MHSQELSLKHNASTSTGGVADIQEHSGETLHGSPNSVVLCVRAYGGRPRGLPSFCSVDTKKGGRPRGLDLEVYLSFALSTHKRKVDLEVYLALALSTQKKGGLKSAFAFIEP